MVAVGILRETFLSQRRYKATDRRLAFSMTSSGPSHDMWRGRDRQSSSFGRVRQQRQRLQSQGQSLGCMEGQRWQRLHGRTECCGQDSNQLHCLIVTPIADSCDGYMEISEDDSASDASAIPTSTTSMTEQDRATGQAEEFVP